MNQISHYIHKVPRGKPFASTSLLSYGQRAAVDKALSRLTQSGAIVRLTRGIYVRPEENRFVGQVLPEPFKIAAVIANKTKAIVQVHSAEAARQFGFTTQVPTQPIFFTSGPSRKLKIGNLDITLKHVSPRKLIFHESKVGLAILALWHLGKALATSQSIEMIRKKLTPAEFTKFKSAKEYMPHWMISAITQHEKDFACQKIF